MQARFTGRYRRRISDISEVRIKDSNISLAKGIWLNMSQGGMLISLPAFGDRLPNSFEISFKIPGTQQTIQALVRLVWLKISLKNVLAGVEFLETDGVFRSAITNAVLRLKVSDMMSKYGLKVEHLVWILMGALFMFLFIKKNL